MRERNVQWYSSSNVHRATLLRACPGVNTSICQTMSSVSLVTHGLFVVRAGKLLRAYIPIGKGGSAVCH